MCIFLWRLFGCLKNYYILCITLAIQLHKTQNTKHKQTHCESDTQKKMITREALNIETEFSIVLESENFLLAIKHRLLVRQDSVFNEYQFIDRYNNTSSIHNTLDSAIDAYNVAYKEGR